MSSFPSANFFQKSMSVHVLNSLTYNMTEVHIDDMLIFGTSDDTLLENTRTVLQWCRDRNVTLNAKNDNWLRYLSSVTKLTSENAKPIYNTTPKQTLKRLTRTPTGHTAFEWTKALVNNIPKLYVVDYNLSIIQYTDTSGYSLGAYLYQLHSLLDGGSLKIPYDFWIVPFRARKSTGREGRLRNLLGSSPVR